MRFPSWLGEGRVQFQRLLLAFLSMASLTPQAKDPMWSSYHRPRVSPKYALVAHSPAVSDSVTPWTAARQASLPSQVLGDWNDNLCGPGAS